MADVEMPLTEHLEELRRRLALSLLNDPEGSYQSRP